MCDSAFKRLLKALDVSADWLLRASIPELAIISDAEIITLLEDCDAEERQMLIKTLIHVKAALRQYGSKKIEKQRARLQDSNDRN